MKKLLNRFFIGFLNGMVILFPIVVTVAIIRFLVLKLNNLVLTPLLRLVGGTQMQHVYIAKAMIFLIVLFSVALIGWTAKVLVINRFFAWWENVFLKIPIMGRIYNAVKQISSAFLGHGKTIFKQVVLVEYPRKGVYSIGFCTGDSKGEVASAAGSGSINVFVPTTPNPTSGIFIVVPRNDVKFLNMSVEDGMKHVISGGTVVPPFTEERHSRASGNL